MDQAFKRDIAKSINRNDLLENFSKALKAAIARKWPGKTVSAAQFATEFNKHCEFVEEIHTETARKWVRGQVFPEPMPFAILHQWLELDVNKIFETIPIVQEIVTKKVNGKINAKDLLEILDGIEEHHNEEEILSIIQSLKAIVIRKI